MAMHVQLPGMMERAMEGTTRQTRQQDLIPFTCDFGSRGFRTKTSRMVAEQSAPIRFLLPSVQPWFLWQTSIHQQCTGARRRRS